MIPRTVKASALLGIIALFSKRDGTSYVRRDRGLLPSSNIKGACLNMNLIVLQTESPVFT